MWENIIQSIRKVKSGDKGLGCILAHTMGLGKTFQVFGSAMSNLYYALVYASNFFPLLTNRKNDKELIPKN